MATNSKQVVLITGANTGIGFETVKALYGSNATYTIILAGRSPEKIEDAVQVLKAEFPNSKSSLDSAQIDLEDDASISKAFEKVSSAYDRLDVLINNGGMLPAT